MRSIRVLLVDDQMLFVENLKTVLELTTDDIEVVGIAANGQEAIEQLDRDLADIVLMDVRMPVMDGVEATKIIREKKWDVRILMLTTFDNDDYVRDALRAGADGYILKNIPPQRLFESIRAMRSGGVLVAPEVAHKVVEWDDTSDPASAPSGSVQRIRREFEALTERERRIIEHISLAYSNKEIAHRTCLSEQTVKNYISRIYSKLGISRRSQLMRLYNETYRDRRRNGS